MSMRSTGLKSLAEGVFSSAPLYGFLFKWTLCIKTEINPCLMRQKATLILAQFQAQLIA